MDTSNYSVGVQSKSVYVQHSAKNVGVGKGSPGDALTKIRAPSVALYEERWENGLDIWTGEPLTGAGLMDWKKQRKKM